MRSWLLVSAVALAYIAEVSSLHPAKAASILSPSSHSKAAIIMAGKRSVRAHPTSSALGPAAAGGRSKTAGCGSKKRSKVEDDDEEEGEEEGG